MTAVQMHNSYEGWLAPATLSGHSLDSWAAGAAVSLRPHNVKRTGLQYSVYCHVVVQL